ncbi:sterol desaturase family protein [Sphingomicrobium arenosum]|uniref:sterol desaturase family protein n=1 Tax=Sphingomicrobium arenosum TaxID=2233861 RepID=UPI00223EC3E5|nr:sterol desaturase family protein [Sphingomicrobium arenosum]
MMFSNYHLIAYGLFAAFAILEILSLGRGRAFPAMKGWRLKGLAFTALYFAVATYSPLMWDAWIGEHSLLDASTLPFWAQILGGFLVLQAFIYAWHRTMHSNDTLWRFFHQMHHSAERIDIWSAFIFHPLDMLGWALVGSLALVGGFGVSGEAGFWIAVAATFCGMFQHSNLKTPRWLGYIVTRPESHSAHHERGVHGRNYGDIPLFDMIFGTFHNPETFEGEVGFYDGASNEVGKLLTFRKVA